LFAVNFSEEQLQYMELLVRHGASTTDPCIRKALVDGDNGYDDDDDDDDFVEEPPMCYMEGNSRRLMVLSAFQALAKLGFDISTEDFILIDVFDERFIPEYNRGRRPI
jgi:hypothetical protein